MEFIELTMVVFDHSNPKSRTTNYISLPLHFKYRFGLTRKECQHRSFGDISHGGISRRPVGKLIISRIWTRSLSIRINNANIEIFTTTMTKVAQVINLSAEISIITRRQSLFVDIILKFISLIALLKHAGTFSSRMLRDSNFQNEIRRRLLWARCFRILI